MKQFVDFGGDIQSDLKTEKWERDCLTDWNHNQISKFDSLSLTECLTSTD